MTLEIPAPLRRRAFTVRQAAAWGVGRQVLRGRRFRRLYRTVYIHRDVALSLAVQVHAAALVLPADAAVSHHTRLQLMGIDVGPRWPLHFSTNSTSQTSYPGITLHRRLGRLTARDLDGVRVLGPDRSFVDAATTLALVHLITAGDWLLHIERTQMSVLAAYVLRSHLDGVQRARRALGHVRERVESPRETLVRLMIVFARLPEPDTNRDIVDARGRFVARGDMPYFGFKVLVEYDGWQHERDSRQRQRDRERRESLDRIGWRVIVVTAEDLKDKREVVWRVYQALRERGFAGRPPHLNAMWTRWFA